MNRYAADDTELLEHLVESRRYAELIEAGANAAGVDSSIIWAIGSRESAWGLALRPRGPGGTGDFAPRGTRKTFRAGPMPPDGLGYGRGLMQIDFDAHEFGRDGQWADPVENIMYGAMVLRDARRYLAAKTSLYGVALLQAAIAAYNCGAGNVIASIVRERSVDTRTAHGNYSEDVLDRADWYKRKDSK